MFLTPDRQLFSYIMARTSYIQGNDDDVRFILDQHTYADVYTASSQKQHSAGRHVVPLGHIIFIARQPVVLLSAAYLAGETTDVNFIIFGLTRSVLEPTIYHTRGEHDNLYTTDEPTIYHTRGEHDNRYTTDEPTIYHTRGEHDNLYTTDEPTIYHTRGEHDNRYTTDESTIYHTRGEHDNLYTTDEPTIYHTRGEHDNLYTTDALQLTLNCG
jgi:hypothetical protein